MERLLLKPTEVAEAASLGRSTVYELIEKGVIPSIRIGRSLRVPVADLKGWIQSQLRKDGENAE